MPVTVCCMYVVSNLYDFEALFVWTSTQRIANIALFLRRHRLTEVILWYVGRQQ